MAEHSEELDFLDEVLHEVEGKDDGDSEAKGPCPSATAIAARGPRKRRGVPPPARRRDLPRLGRPCPSSSADAKRKVAMARGSYAVPENRHS